MMEWHVTWIMLNALTQIHISHIVCYSIDGEYVPKEGDEVTYKTVLIPPRNEKIQAVHVKITHLKPGVSHEKWDSPPQ